MNCGSDRSIDIHIMQLNNHFENISHHIRRLKYTLTVWLVEKRKQTKTNQRQFLG